jgi:hypothetical protein
MTSRWRPVRVAEDQSCGCFFAFIFWITRTVVSTIALGRCRNGEELDYHARGILLVFLVCAPRKMGEELACSKERPEEVRVIRRVKLKWG